MKDPKIIYEDESLLVVDKPPFWVVNESGTTVGENTIQEWIFKNFSFSLAKNREFRSGVVHRLDKETSGVLVVAKDRMSFENLQLQFKNRLVKKVYTALVHGRVGNKKGRINISIGRLPWRRDRFGVLPGGREAETEYFVTSSFRWPGSNEFFDLLEFYPKTGRTHQIRVHSKYIGHPIVSDQFYAGRKSSRKDRVWCPRLFLHASRISFLHPESSKEIIFISKLPGDLRKSLSYLERVRM